MTQCLKVAAVGWSSLHPASFISTSALVLSPASHRCCPISLTTSWSSLFRSVLRLIFLRNSGSTPELAGLNSPSVSLQKYVVDHTVFAEVSGEQESVSINCSHSLNCLFSVAWDILTWSPPLHQKGEHQEKRLVKQSCPADWKLIFFYN